MGTEHRENWRRNSLTPFESSWSVIAKFCRINYLNPSNMVGDWLTQSIRDREPKIVVETLEYEQFFLIAGKSHVQFCPICINSGYHAAFHQSPLFSHCLLHGRKLESKNCDSIVGGLTDLYFGTGSRWHSEIYANWKCAYENEKFLSILNLANWLKEQGAISDPSNYNICNVSVTPRHSLAHGFDTHEENLRARIHGLFAIKNPPVGFQKYLANPPFYLFSHQTLTVSTSSGWLDLQSLRSDAVEDLLELRYSEWRSSQDVPAWKIYLWSIVSTLTRDREDDWDDFKKKYLSADLKFECFPHQFQTFPIWVQCLYRLISRWMVSFLRDLRRYARYPLWPSKMRALSVNYTRFTRKCSCKEILYDANGLCREFRFRALVLDSNIKEEIDVLIWHLVDFSYDAIFTSLTENVYQDHPIFNANLSYSVEPVDLLSAKLHTWSIYPRITKKTLYPPCANLLWWIDEIVQNMGIIHHYYLLSR